MIRHPKVSFILPVLDAAAHLPRCLESVSLQHYPPEQLEVIVADGGSTDATLEIVRRWRDEQRVPLRLVENRRRIAEFGKAEALKVATGDFIVLLDADNRLCDPDWLKTSLRGLELFPDAFGFESCYLPISDGPALNNYLTACLHISDPLAWATASSLREIAARTEDGVCYRQHHIPPGYPCGANGFVYRRSALDPYVDHETFEEAVVPMDISLRSESYIVTADNVGIQHYYADSMREFLRKRSKTALKSHTRRQERTTWIDFTGHRLYRAAALQMTFLWPFAYSIFRAFRDRTARWLLHAPVCFTTAWFYLLNWIWIRIWNTKAW